MSPPGVFHGGAGPPGLVVRPAGPQETDLVGAVYRSFGYRRAVNPADLVWLAEAERQPIGIVRVAAEGQTLVLRGMRVVEAWRRSGVGTRMLRAVDRWLGARECYCVPYSHLERFYGQIGFSPIDAACAPPFLSERVMRYRGEGLDVILMKRP